MQGWWARRATRDLPCGVAVDARLCPPYDPAQVFPRTDSAPAGTAL